MAAESADGQVSAKQSRPGCIIGLAGASGSGKTTLARRLADRFEGQSLIISQDRYYKDLSNLTESQRDAVNFDHPDALEWDMLVRDLKMLKGGEDVTAPIYDFRSHTRAKSGERVKPKPLLIVEGILILHVPEIREILDYSVFLDVAADTRFIRRLERDIRERSRTARSVIRQYMETVRPMYEEFVKPTSQFADIVLDTSGDMNPGEIERRVGEMLNQRK